MSKSLWRIEESGPLSAEKNMQLDEESLQAVSLNSRPILRFYVWEKPAATYGYFLNPWNYFDEKEVQKIGLQLARRPTGGGVIFHTDDLAFSIVVPASHPFYDMNPLTSYLNINQTVLQALQQLNLSGELYCPSMNEVCRGGFCMAKPTQYDLLLNGKKVGGASQRKTKKGLLHQGSLCLRLPNARILKTVKSECNILDAMLGASYCLATENEDLDDLRSNLKKALMESITNYE